MFPIIPTALAKLEELQKHPCDVLNVSIIGAGCSGYSYQMKWLSHETSEVAYDRLIFSDFSSGVQVGTDHKSAIFLEDIQLDYEGGLNGKGFVWDKPSAKRVCGCGSSFST